MSQQLLKQNKMLKEYIQVLERQNHSRNIQKDVLLREIQNLNHENQGLRAEVKRVGGGRQGALDVDGLVRTKQQLEAKVKEVQAALDRISQNKLDLQSQNTSLKSQLQTLTQSPPISPQTHKTLLKTLQQTQSQLSLKNSQIAHLQQQTSQLQQKLITIQQQKQQLEKKEQKEQLGQMEREKEREKEKLRERERVRKELEMENQEEMRKITNYFNQCLKEKEARIQGLETKLRELEEGHKNSDVQLNNLRATNQQLQIQVQTSQSQTQTLHQKLKQLNLQVSQKTVLLHKRQQQAEQLHTMRVAMSKKQQQLLNSGSVIEALKNNVAMLEKKVGELEMQVVGARERSQGVEGRRVREVRDVEERYRRELEELREKLEQQQKNFPHILNEQRRVSSQKHRQNNQLKKIISQLSQNNTSLLQKLKQLQQKEQVPQADGNEIKNQADLRNVVEQLRRELKTVKSEFRKIQQDNKKMENFMSSKVIDTGNFDSQKAYPNVQDTFNANLLLHKDRKTPAPTSSNQISASRSFKSINFNQQLEDPNIKYSKLKNETQKYRAVSNQDIGKSMNRDKWQLLQRRITQLRQQNAQLKQSLYP